MDRRAWWATVHGVAESDMTEHCLLELLIPHTEHLATDPSGDQEILPGHQPPTWRWHQVSQVKG